ncbi:MAG: hypothetical protein HC831_29625 [Chloroflexia bacterium]|nr:hypothetical protein [Chloroflexia bacterium]
MMVEATNNWKDISNQIKYTIDDYNIDNRQLIVLINKIDKTIMKDTDIDALKEEFPETNVVLASAKHKTNIEELTNILKKTYDIQSISETDVIVSNARHYEALQQAFEALERVEGGAEKRNYR